MKSLLSNRTGRLPARVWLPVLPTLVILVLTLALTNTTAAAATTPTVLLTELLFQVDEPVCQTCHAEEYDIWKTSTHANATLDPLFQEHLSRSSDQQGCLACHTTGFDSGSGQFMSEGVTCEACHGQYKEDHPKAETMQLPMESDTCRMCHEATFDQWEASKHATEKIDCFDCHQAHSQGLRLGSQEKLCNACHADEETQLAHSVHNISGVDCASCHVSTQANGTSNPTGGAQMAMSNHTFTVASDVCTRCHAGSAHKEAAVSQAEGENTADSAIQAAGQQSQRIQELELKVNEAQKQTNDLRNLAVIAMGLSLGVGGAVGLLLGVGGATLLGRRKGS